MGGQPSHLRAAVRLLARGVRRGRPPDRSTTASPSRRLAVERSGIRPTAEQVRRYLGATRGEGADAETGVIPPTYAAVWETALLLELLGMDGMPFPSGGLVHLRGEVVRLRPLRLGDPIRCRVELERGEEGARGTQLLLRCRSWNGAGQLCEENATEILVRSRNRGGGRTGERREREPRGDAGEPAWHPVAAWTLDAGAGLRYARASGDFNPIHLWPWSARLLGFPGPILHGHCSLAMVAHELVRQDGGTLRRIDAAFRAPLLLPATVRLEAAEGRYRLIDAADGGRRAYVEGAAVIES